jgi:hypothetical protein
MQKTIFNKISFFVGVLKVNDENSRIRIRIRIRIYSKMSWICNTVGTDIKHCHSADL